MKRYIFIALATMFMLQSCDKFLTLKPENLKVVSTIEDYRDLMAGYMNKLKTVNTSATSAIGNPPFDVGRRFAYRTGELTPNRNYSYYYDATLGEYKQLAVDMMTWMSPADDLWDGHYKFLGSINMIIGGIETAEGDNEQLRDYVKGEALVWRAYSYFKLLQYFSPYKLNDYGIPVYLKSYESPGTAMPERKKQTDVFKQILSDCHTALDMLQRTPTNTWNYAYDARFINGMLASVYCWKALSAASEESDWENALHHADQAMIGRTFVRDPETYRRMFDVPTAEVFTNDEFYFRLVGGYNMLWFKNEYYFPWASSAEAEISPDADFYALYKDDDVRKTTFFEDRGDVIFDKYNLSEASYSQDGGVILLFRAAECQLIKAEALYRLGREGEAKEALDFFKKGRYIDVAGSYTESDLLNEILKERKLEFYHEQDMWWLDMKRTGTRVERVVNGTLHILEPDDFRYCFPIPSSEMSTNKKMIQNPGWDEVNF